jgi:hypothetical protein
MRPFGRQQLANVLNAVAGTYYYPNAMGREMGAHSVLSLHLANVDDCTITVEVSNQDQLADGIAVAALNWQDVTALFRSRLDASNLTYVANNFIQCNGLDAQRYRVKVVTVDATNSYRITAREM